MKLKKKIFRILSIILWALLFSGAGFLVGFADYEQDATICRHLEIQINYGQSDPLMTQADIEQLIREKHGPVKGKALWQINTEKIERIVRQQPYVAAVNVYGTNRGDLFVMIDQRQPVLRIITGNQHSFYLGDQGDLFPVNPDLPARVLIANGSIPSSLRENSLLLKNRINPDATDSTRVLAQLFKLASVIYSHDFFRAQIDQIYVNPSGEFELVPKVGNHMILFGDVDDVDDKFQRLMVFYTYGLNQIGWNKYNLINIKFKNQVVCSKI